LTRDIREKGIVKSIGKGKRYIHYGLLHKNYAEDYAKDDKELHLTII